MPRHSVRHPKNRSAGKAGIGKYGAKAVTIDGIRFDSKKEGARYRVLKAMQDKGEIRELRCHPRYPIEVNGVKVCTVVPDFDYIKDGEGVVAEDVKGSVATITPTFRLKKKLFEAIYPFKITVVI